MKKLYFLNEEESIRILNLHKDATKRQYITENNKKLITEATGAYDSPLTDAELKPEVATLTDEIDGWVGDENTEEIFKLIKKFSTLFAINDDIVDVETIEPAIKRITTLYKLDTNDNLRTIISSIGEGTLSVEAKQMKNWTLQYYDKGLALKNPATTPVAGATTTTTTTSAASDDAAKVSKKTVDTKNAWKNFPCVPKHPNAKEEEAGGESTYLINNINYFSDGTKVTYKKDASGNWKNDKEEQFTCNDREFKTTRSGSTVKQLKTPLDAELDDVLSKL